MKKSKKGNNNCKAENPRSVALHDMRVCGINVRIFDYEEALCGHKIDGRKPFKEITINIEI